MGRSSSLYLWLIPLHLGMSIRIVMVRDHFFGRFCRRKCRCQIRGIQNYLGERHSVKLRTNPRIHGWDNVSRTTIDTIDTIELLYSYLAGMNGVAYTMHNVLCRSVTIEARFTAFSRSSGSRRDWSHVWRWQKPPGIRYGSWVDLAVYLHTKTLNTPPTPRRSRSGLASKNDGGVGWGWILYRDTNIIWWNTPPSLLVSLEVI
jgi:hypothetical protein